MQYIVIVTSSNTIIVCNSIWINMWWSARDIINHFSMFFLFSMRIDWINPCRSFTNKKKCDMKSELFRTHIIICTLHKAHTHFALKKKEEKKIKTNKQKILLIGEHANIYFFVSNYSLLFLCFNLKKSALAHFSMCSLYMHRIQQHNALP